ncbi:hypothetical protein [Pseudomonas sp. NFX98]|uniref:hypothetical protein n=1 Tax=Pseudomonas sp. NFX98 TaxID=3399122 RepID=UPI0039FBD0A5
MTCKDLRKAHQNIAKLIIMHRESSTELAALKVENQRLKWTLGEMYSQERGAGGIADEIRVRRPCQQ